MGQLSNGSQAKSAVERKGGRGIDSRADSEGAHLFVPPIWAKIGRQPVEDDRRQRTI